MDVTHVITGLDDGGAEAILWALVSHDDQSRHRIISLTGEGKYGALLRASGFDVQSFAFKSLLHAVRDAIRIERSVAAARPDVIQTWMYHADLIGGIIGYRLGVPVVWGVHNTTLSLSSSSRATRWIRTACALLSSRIPSRIVCCAAAAKQEHVRAGYDPGRMVLVRNGYDLRRFAPLPVLRQQLRSSVGVQDDVPLIGIVGRFHPQKDYATGFAALGSIARRGLAFKVAAAGTGMSSENSELQSIVLREGLKDRVTLLGRRNDIEFVYSAFDVLLLCSSSGEASPNVVAEAMSCGTPCIVTDVGDAAFIVGETGWVAPPSDPVALAGQIEQAVRVWRDAVAWETRKAAARARIVEHLSLDRMIEGYRRVWSEVVQGAPEDGKLLETLAV